MKPRYLLVFALVIWLVGCGREGLDLSFHEPIKDGKSENVYVVEHIEGLLRFSKIPAISMNDIKAVEILNSGGDDTELMISVCLTEMGGEKAAVFFESCKGKVFLVRLNDRNWAMPMLTHDPGDKFVLTGPNWRSHK